MVASLETYKIKRGSRAGIRMQLLQGNNQPMPLADATSIRLQLRPLNGGPLTMDREATQTNQAPGEVEVIPDASEVDTPGQYLGEWRITYSGGDIIIPNDDYIRFVILDSLAPTAP
jgi:hypothetical protein